MSPADDHELLLRRQSAVQAATKIFAGTETTPQEGWEAFVASKIQEGPKGQVTLLLALAKAVGESKLERLASLKDVCRVLLSNFESPQMWFPENHKGQPVELGNLMEGHQSLPGGTLYRLLKILGGQFELDSIVINDGTIGKEQGSRLDFAAVRFGYLPAMIVRLEVKHPDRFRTDVTGFVDRRFAEEAVFDSRSQVTALTAVPILAPSDANARPQLW